MINKMQSGTADFAPSAATWWCQPQCCVTSDWYRHLANWMKQGVLNYSLLDYSLHYMKPRHPINRKHNISHCHHRRIEPRPQVTCKENLGEIWTRGFRDMWETNRHTDHNTLHSSGGGGRSNDTNTAWMLTKSQGHTMLHYTENNSCSVSTIIKQIHNNNPCHKTWIFIETKIMLTTAWQLAAVHCTVCGSLWATEHEYANIHCRQNKQVQEFRTGRCKYITHSIIWTL